MTAIFLITGICIGLDAPIEAKVVSADVIRRNRVLP